MYHRLAPPHLGSHMWDKNIQKDCGACHQKTGMKASATSSILPFAVTLSASVSLSGAGLLVISVVTIKGEGVLYILLRKLLLGNLVQDRNIYYPFRTET